MRAILAFCISLVQSSLAESTMKINVFKEVNLTDNLFDQTENFRSLSKIECSIVCLWNEDYASCTGYVFNKLDKVCQCGLAYLPSSNSATETIRAMVNVECNPTQGGTYQSKYLITWAQNF